MARYWFLIAVFRFLVDFLLILAAKQLMGQPSNWQRAVLAGFLGGCHAAACFLPGFAFLGEAHWHLIGLSLTALVAFGMEKRLFPGALLFVLLRLAIDGVGEGGIWSMVAVGVVLLLLCGRGGAGKGSFAHVCMAHGGKTIELTALLDTGNTLKDPVSGLRVLVVGSDVARELVGLGEEALQKPVETLAAMPAAGLRLIPYSAIGQPSGLLLGLRPNSIHINGEKAERIIAFAPQIIGQGNGYQALAGGIA